MVLKPAILIAALLTASGVAAHPQIYTYVDANGMRHYTDVPDNNRYRLLVMSPQDRTASGDRYDAMLLAKAGQSGSVHVSAADKPTRRTGARLTAAFGTRGRWLDCSLDALPGSRSRRRARARGGARGGPADLAAGAAADL